MEMTVSAYVNGRFPLPRGKLAGSLLCGGYGVARLNMTWLIALAVVAVGIVLFIWGYGRRLRFRAGPWMMRELSKSE
jgi:hypothetical protein